MSGRLPIPINTMAHRVPEAGRIRIGKKTTSRNGKEIPQALPMFRFSSHDTTALNQIAALYGGTVAPWHEPKAAEGQSQVFTDATEIRIVLPPDPLGGSPIYEQWGGGGCERRCDGLNATILQQGPDGLEYVDTPCLCAAKGEMVCDPHTRLSVILPEVRFAGVWRLDTKSWNAAQELPGMVALIQQLQGEGLSYATLAIKPRVAVIAGETKRFLVPVLGVGASIEQLVAGGARLAAIAAADVAVGELEACDPEELTNGDADRLGLEHDDVVDAELVDDDHDGVVTHADLAAACTSAKMRNRALGAAREAAVRLGIDVPAAFDAIIQPELIGAALVALGFDGSPPDGPGGGASPTVAHETPPVEANGAAGEPATPAAPDAEPAPAGARGRALNARDVAIHSGRVFKPDGDAAVKGDKTRTVERLRHALVWAVTARRTTSLTDCTPAEWAGVTARLEQIESGWLTYEHDVDGVVFSHVGEKPFELEIHYADLADGAEASAA